ncbi:biotin/lipoate--protein ligase family protein [Roseomonas sp. E05]|uniref:biotin/lipoate--protein ligase family protein n=1 Tax=Roseomonas sp. E05 TaxID=3046310 RepID=UPI0024B90ACB|nr:biotin/lipoate--protein ligase family protein [Roseomonas sp. E05]MDJ0390442.1 biotin/lipoate--protein ligase family protein [Roseomonas sp. E05]
MPSLFDPVPLGAGEDARARAMALASERGGGTLTWLAAPERVEAALVLEPEEPLAAARAAVLAAANAFADALVVLGPPEIPVTLRWPAGIVLNSAVVGDATLGEPPGFAEEAVPDWLVVGFRARWRHPPGYQPGLDPGRTALAEEGFLEVPPEELVAGWARHLMVSFAEWQARGFPAMAERVLARLEVEDWMRGARRGLDPASGDLILRRDGGETRHSLAQALAEAGA